MMTDGPSRRQDEQVIPLEQHQSGQIGPGETRSAASPDGKQYCCKPSNSGMCGLYAGTKCLSAPCLRVVCQLSSDKP